MNRMQKISWMMVICIGIATVLSTIAVTVLYFRVGFPRAWSGLTFLGIAGFGGLSPLIFKKDPGPIQTDERDKLINLKAARAGFALSYLVFGLLSMGIWEYCRHHNTSVVSIEVLPFVWTLSALTAFFTHAVTILTLYGKDNKLPEGGAV